MTSFQYTKADNILKVENLNLTLNNNLILRDINFDIKDILRPGQVQGQIVGIIGGSGKGKSQLLKCLSAIFNPIDHCDPRGYTYMTGSVLRGKDLIPVERGSISLVQQQSPLFEHRTVISNLKRVANKLKGKEKDEKIEAYLNHFGLWDKRNLYPNQLSGGMKQRAALAQAFINAEHIVLLDEPTASLDPYNTSMVTETIVNTANLDDQNTIIVVSHSIQDTMSIADTVYMLGSESDKLGTTIKSTYDLIEMNFAWHPDLFNNPQFNQFVAEVRNIFMNSF